MISQPELKAKKLPQSGRRLRAYAIAIAIVVLAVAGKCTGQTVIFANPNESIFLRLAGMLILLSASFGLGKWLWTKHASGKLTQWWDIGGKADDPDWEDVRLMTMGAPVYDPVCYTPKERSAPYLLSTIYLIAAFIILGCFTLVGMSIVAQNQALPFLLTDFSNRSPTKSDAGMILNFSANITAFLALLAAAVSIYFTHRQLQAKVKADSRQAWIDKLRARIAKTIALAGTHRNSVSGSIRRSVYQRLTDARLETELMLNPSEKDHRLLMYLMIKISWFESCDDFSKHDRFKEIDDVKNVVKSIRKCPRYVESKWKKILGPIPEQSDELRDSIYSDLIGYTMRLSHVVLKREWERVKATR